MGQFISKLLQISDLAALTSGAGRMLVRASDDAAWELRVLAASDITSGTLASARGGTSFSTYTTGDLIYASATNTLAKLAPYDGIGQQVLKMQGSVPSWVDYNSTNLNDTSTLMRISAYPTVTAFEAYNTNGFIAQTSADTFAGRTVTGTAGKITVTNGDGVSGDPTLTTGDNVPLLDAANTFTAATNTFAASGTTTKTVVKSGSAQSTNALLEFQNSSAGVLGDVKMGTYTNARVRLNITNTASLTTGDATSNTLEVYDVGSSDYKLQIRPRRNTAGGALTDILLDPAYTRIYANATGANTTGRLDLYYSQLYFQGTNVYFSNTVNLNRLGDATVANQYGSGVISFEPSLWSGSAAQTSPTTFSVKPDTSTTLQFRYVFEGRVLPTAGTTEELMQIYRNGFVGINVPTVKPGAALEVKIGASTTYVADSTVTQRNRKRSSSQTGNLFETTNESGTVENAVDADGIQILKTKTPSSATDTGTTGMIAWDASYIYICTTTNTWKRVAIATW